MKCPCCGHPNGSLDLEQIEDFLEFTPMQKVIFSKLRSRFGQPIRTEEVLSAMYGSRSDGGPISGARVIHVCCCTMRKKLKPYNLTIKGYSSSVYGDGALRLKYIDQR